MTVSSTYFLIWLLFLSVISALVTVAFILGHDYDEKIIQLRRGEEGHFRFAAVASNTDVCSKIGTEIMAKKGGGAVDAAIATMACVGVVRFESSGIGGDGVWTIYHRESGKAYTIMSRAMAPLASTADMFVNKSQELVEGGLSVAVPGEIKAFWEAHRRFGHLPWADLFQPAIDLAQNGFPCGPSTAQAIQDKIKTGIFDRNKALRMLVINEDTGTWYKEGETIRRPKLAATLRKIATGGANEFYNGSLTDEMVKEIQEMGGIVTKEDFQAYFSDVTAPLTLRLHGNLTLYSPTLPSSGPVLQYILNILSGFNMTATDFSTNEKTILTYHRILESFKHAYAARSEMGSPYGEAGGFVREMDRIVANLTSKEQGEAIRSLILDNTTLPWKSYNPSFTVVEDHGTSQLSVLGPNGDAVSTTSTVNFFFGSKVVGPRTGVLYNDLMDDFSTPGVANGFGVQPSPANFIKPGKRPLSSTCPSVVVDQNGRAILVIGAAGGTKITTATAFLTALTLWLGEDMKSAIDAPRIHHQLYPDEVKITSNAPQWLINGLRNKGHTVTIQDRLGTPTGILQRQAGHVLANSQGAIVDGY